MQQTIKTEEISQYKGDVLAEDIIMNDLVVYPSGTIVDDDMVTRLTPIAWVYPTVTLQCSDLPKTEHELNMEVGTKVSKQISAMVHSRTDDLLRSYSFSGFDDTTMLFDVMDQTFESSMPPAVISLIAKYIFPDEIILNHSINTAIVSALLAIKSGRFPKWILDQLVCGAVLHDIGKLALQEKYSTPFSELSPEIQQEHAILGYELIKDFPQLSDGVKKIVLMHHVWQFPEKSLDAERGLWLSYPQQYNGHEMSQLPKGLPVSIVHVASEFEQKSAEGCMDTREIIMSIVHNQELIFGPGALLLANYIAPFPIGAEVILNNGKRAIIIEQTDDVLNPIVRMRNFRRKVVDLRKDPNVWVDTCVES